MDWLLRFLAGTKAFRSLVYAALSQMIRIEELGQYPYSAAVKMHTMGAEILVTEYGPGADGLRAATYAREYFIDQITDRLCAKIRQGERGNDGRHLRTLQRN